MGDEPFTVEHFERWAHGLTLDAGDRWRPEQFQLEIVEDVFGPAQECWIIIPEGNGKTTLLAGVALYGAQHSKAPWIPIGASSRDQAEIMFAQAAGFVERSRRLQTHFRTYFGYRKIQATQQGGRGIRVYAADVKTGDGVIPFPYALIDELHRHDDLHLYRLWKGKLRKRGGKIVTISTAGEPGTEFEETRDRLRRTGTDRRRVGSHLRVASPALVMHEWMVQSEAGISDMEQVKAANPFSGVSVVALGEDFASETTELVDWKRLKCNRASRGSETAITDAEWDRAQTEDRIPEGARISLGADFAWKWDTTALVPYLATAREDRLIGEPRILTPPRDGSTLHPDVVKDAILQIQAANPIDTVVMDISNAEDLAAWIEDELRVEVVDRGQTNQFAVMDYERFMEALRNGWLRHTGDPGLRKHVLNAVARRLPGGDHRFDRPSTSRNASRQERRVIDALTAAAMVNCVVGGELGDGGGVMAFSAEELAGGGSLLDELTGGG